MTRWAKAGTSQKYKKAPEDATPWEELSKNVKGKFKSKFATPNKHVKPYQKQVAKEKSTDEKTISFLNDQVSNNDGAKKLYAQKQFKGQKKTMKKVKLGVNEKLHCQSFATKQFKKHDEQNMKVEEDSCETKMACDQTLSTQQVSEIKRKSKLEKDVKQFKTQIVHNQSFFSNQNNRHGEKRESKDNESFESKIITNRDSNEATTSDEQIHKGDECESLHKDVPGSLPTNKLSRKQKKMIERQKSQLEKGPDISSEKSEDQTQSKSRKPFAKQRLNKKQLFLEKRKQRRKELGIMLLPQNIENRIYRIKKSLRKKNFLPEQIKDIIREERRKAQNEFKKTQITKMCFNCREFGHLVVNCPTLKNEDGQETGICFKCGSTEHTSARCKKKVNGFPFASCFICKSQGHISRDCPDNKHGIYPKGGKCNLCDSINHLRKDCPTLKKKKEEDTSVTLYTIDEGATIDDEIIDTDEAPIVTKSKKPKIVKF